MPEAGNGDEGSQTVQDNNYNPPADDPPYANTSERSPEEAEWENE